jgi:hypothetical protein
MHRLLPILTVVCLFALAAPARGQVASPVPLTLPDPVAAAQQRADGIGAQITDAQAQLDAVQASLDAWSARLDRADRGVTIAERRARLAGQSGGRLRMMRVAMHTMRMSVARPSVAVVALALARQRLERVRVDPAAATALQAVMDAQSRIAELEQDRAEAEGDVQTLSDAAAAGASFQEPDAGTWARLFLTYVGAPACEDNVVTLVAWQAQESTSARFNPLATTHDMPGASAFNEVGVRNFVSLGQGLEATLATLEAPVESYGYGSILAALRSCLPAETSALYVNASAWCRGCSGGAYLTGLVPLVRADLAAYAARV